MKNLLSNSIFLKQKLQKIKVLIGGGTSEFANHKKKSLALQDLTQGMPPNISDESILRPQNIAFNQQYHNAKMPQLLVQNKVHMAVQKNMQNTQTQERTSIQTTTQCIAQNKQSAQNEQQSLPGQNFKQLQTDPFMKIQQKMKMNQDGYLVIQKQQNQIINLTSIQKTRNQTDQHLYPLTVDNETQFKTIVNDIYKRITNQMASVVDSSQYKLLNKILELGMIPFHKLKRSLRTHPYSATIATGCLISCSGDIVSQLFDMHQKKKQNHKLAICGQVYDFKQPSYDFMRTLRGILYSALISTNLNFVCYFKILPKLAPVDPFNPKIINVCWKVFLDESVMTIICQAVYLYANSILRSQSHSLAIQQYKDNWKDIFKMDLSIWPAVQFLNFYVIPLKFQVLIVQFVDVFWSAFCSNHINRYNSNMFNINT